MKTLIQKDLRENLKVALIGFVIFSLMLLGAFMSSVGSLNNLLAGIPVNMQPGTFQPLLASTLLQEAAFFAPSLARR